MGDVPLPSFLDNHQSASSIDLPNIHPLKSTISMEKTHFYNTDDYYRKCKCKRGRITGRYNVKKRKAFLLNIGNWFTFRKNRN